MAKNTSSSAFRKIDVDQYCEDNFKEDETDSGGLVGPDESEVNSLLQKGKLIDALKTVLTNAPVGIKNQQIKENALNLTLRVLLSIKPSQIEEAVSSLDITLIDTLMKYVYKGFENPSEGSSGHLLLWHEKIYNVGGVGCIVRVLADTRRLLRFSNVLCKICDRLSFSKKDGIFLGRNEFYSELPEPNQDGQPVLRDTDELDRIFTMIYMTTKIKFIFASYDDAQKP